MSARIRLFLALLLVFLSACTAQADAVTEWNEIAAALGPLATSPLPQSRAYAMVHAAIHDALNAIDRRYEIYIYRARPLPAASPEAAVAAAAYGVLIAVFPTQKPALDAAYSNSLAAISDGSAKSQGISIGQAAAAAVLAFRSNDGSASAGIPYTETPAPGVWVPTPPGFLPAALPGWGNVTTFGLNHGAQFRPDVPDMFDLTSAAYAREYQEVQSIGDVNSLTRTIDQSDIARFWYEPSPLGWNRIARSVSAQKNLGLWENGRLFALLNFALADGFIAGFNAKYFYHFWRPITAIRAGDFDDNPETMAVAGWTSFLINPNSPDYPSTHSILGAASAEVLSSFFGTDFVSFSMTSGPPFSGYTRSYSSFSQASLENANSRVFAGIHFRTATTDGVKMGEKIGRFIYKHSLEPVKRLRVPR